ncbi:30S ribosomal protein S2 [Candidatus Woesearchaeota archaeon]|nr:30S ribosomal protein S2 [Candidatus Woesearchaeota archaeon]
MTTNEQELLVPLEAYLKSGIHIGTKYKNSYMEPFIYKIRNDGLFVLNVQEVDKRLRLLSNFINQYSPGEMVIVCRRENGWDAVNKFSEITGIKAFIGRYPPGMLTNPNLERFTETKMIFVVDPIPDKNAVKDAAKIRVPVAALCDTNNDSLNVDFCCPCNNKGKKSLGLVFFILAREYQSSRKKEFSASIEDFEKE